MATLDGKPLQSVHIVFGRRQWQAHIEYVADPPTVGTSLTLDLDGGNTWAGVVRRSSRWVGFSRVTIEGGSAWRTQMQYLNVMRSDPGIRVHTIINQIRAAAGNPPVLVTEPDRIVGGSCAFFKGNCGQALDALGVPWYTRRDGATVIGPPVGGTVDATRYFVGALEHFGHVTLRYNEPSLAVPIFDAFGGTLEGDPLEAPVPIDAIELWLQGKDERIDL